MSKRRISKQQSARIQKIQDSYHQQANTSIEDGLVIARFSRHVEIENQLGERINCSIRPHIDSLVAGDKVLWQSEGTNQGVVVSRYPRQSVLGRPAKQGQTKPIAANISQIMVVTAAKPELVSSLLDSYLIMAEHLALPLCIVLNKTDIPCESIRQELSQIYEPLGYPIVYTSKYDQQSLQVLKEKLNEQTSVFVGQSGVGKSSLIANILPHEMAIQTAEISASSELGCHTTSNSRLYHLPSGGELIDSPGIREFGLWHMSSAEIAYGYREFRPLIARCKFRNCDHKDNPGCAIVASLNKGELTQKRYGNFIKITSMVFKK